MNNSTNNQFTGLARRSPLPIPGLAGCGLIETPLVAGIGAAVLFAIVPSAFARSEPGFYQTNPQSKENAEHVAKVLGISPLVDGA